MALATESQHVTPDRQELIMTRLSKANESPPEEGKQAETLEESGPMGRAVARLIVDDDTARDLYRQLERIRFRYAG